MVCCPPCPNGAEVVAICWGKLVPVCTPVTPMVERRVGAKIPSGDIELGRMAEPISGSVVVATGVLSAAARGVASTVTSAGSKFLATCLVAGKGVCSIGLRGLAVCFSVGEDIMAFCSEFPQTVPIVDVVQIG